MKLFILDNNENLIGSLSGDAEKSATHFFNAVVVKELNKGRQLTFEVDMKEDGVADLIKEEHHVIFKDGEKFRLVTIKEVVDIHNSDFIKEVFCDDASIELYDEVILTDLDSTVSHEVDDVANHILRDTRWTLGECDNVRRMKLTDKLATKTVLNGLNMIVDKFNVEVDFEVEFVHNRISERRVILKEKLGRDLGKRIEYRKDMESLKRTVDSSEIKTAVIPFGKQNEETGEYVTIRDVIWTADRNGLDKPAGQLYLEDKTATEQWGYKGGNGKRPRWIAIEYPEVESPNELINYANMQLASHKEPKVTYEVEAVDLYKLLDDEAYSFETLEIGDAVAIIDREFNPPLTLKSRIVKIEESYSKWNSGRKITLGNVIPTLVDKDIKTQVAELGGAVGSVTVDLSGINNRLDNLENKTGTGVWEALEPINQILFNQESGYHYMSESDGIWVYDRPADQQPTKAIVLKGGQLGIAKWDKQTQSWKVGTFIDGNNVNASMINTGTLSADRIKAGSITAEKLEVSVKNKINNSVTNEEVEAKLKVQSDNIKAEVSNTYETKEEVVNKINNIQVGTRNLLMRTKSFDEDSKRINGFYNQHKYSRYEEDGVTVLTKSQSGLTKNSIQNLYASHVPCRKGDKFVVSVWFKIDDVSLWDVQRPYIWEEYNQDKSRIVYQDMELTVSNSNKPVVVNGEWVLMTSTHTITNDSVRYCSIRLSLFRNGTIHFKTPMIERGTKPSDWTQAPEDVEEDMKIIKTEMNNFENTVNTTFKDGIISQAEATAIKQHLNTLETTKAEIDKEYASVYGNAVLSSTLKSELSSAKKGYDNAYTSLKSFINTAIEDDSVTEQEKNSVNSAFTTYNTAVGTYKTAIQKSLDYISTAKVENLEIGGVNYVRDYKFERTDVWTCSNSSAKIDTTNNCLVLAGTTSNPHGSQSVPLEHFKNGETYTIQYELKMDNVSANTGTDSCIIRSMLTGYTASGGHIGDVLIFGKHEGELNNYTEWTKVVVTGTLNSSRMETTEDLKLRLYARNFTGNVYFRNVKLEKGNKATDLSQSPKDMVTAEKLNDQLQGLIDQSNDLMLKYENMVTDKVITPNEKIQLKAELEQMTDKYENIGLLVDAIDNPTLDNHYQELKTLYDDVKATLQPFLLDMTTVQNADESAIYLKISAFHGQYETVLRLAQTVLNNTVTTVKTEVNQVATGVQTAITKSEEALGVTKTIGKHFEFTEDGWVRIYASLNGVRGSFMTQITDSRLSFYDGETEVAYISNKDLYITDARIINTLHVGNMALEKSAKGGMIFKWKG